MTCSHSPPAWSNLVTTKKYFDNYYLREQTIADRTTDVAKIAIVFIVIFVSILSLLLLAVRGFAVAVVILLLLLLLLFRQKPTIKIKC